MKKIQITYSDQSEYDVSAKSFRLKPPSHKKYLLHKMRTNTIINKQKTLKENEQPAYFQEMYKQQKKKLHVNTFIKKLKNSISLKKPPQKNVEFLEKQQNIKFDFKIRKIPKVLHLGILLFIAIQNTLLLFLNSISIMFEQMNDSLVYKWFFGFSLLIHLLQMVKKPFFNSELDQDKKQLSLQSIEKYLFSNDFALDILLFFSLLIQALEISNGFFLYLSKILICIKIKAIIQIQSYFELICIKNQYRQQVWSLIKVFFFNFIFAHILTIFLVLMANLNSTQNWILKKQLNPRNFSQIYIWGYYWATTTMLTVGFGDLTPTNTSQAICMIFLQTLSCIVLAYNINRLGVIIQKIRSYDLQQITNMKTFNQMSQSCHFSKESKEKINNYIKQSTIIKRDFNFQQERTFLNKLPATFKNQLSKEMYRPIWNGMTFFQNLSQKILISLSTSIQKKLTHPSQIVYSKGSAIDVMVFGKGKFGFSYQNGKAKRNGEIIHQFNIMKNQFKLSTLDFLMQKQLSFDIKCLDYSVFYSINLENFLKILKKSQYDCEYYFMIKDKDKYLINEFQLIKCQFCPNERHNLFKCSKCHYIPFKKHIIDKHLFKKNKGLNFFKKVQKRENKKIFKALLNIKVTQIQAQRKRIQIQNQRKYTEQPQRQGSQSKTAPYQPISLNIIELNSIKSYNNSMKFENSHMLQNALQKVQNNLKNQLIENKSFWQVESDKVYNFKYYFKKYNADDFFTKKNNRFKPGFKTVQKVL